MRSPCALLGHEPSLPAPPTPTAASDSTSDSGRSHTVRPDVATEGGATLGAVDDDAVAVADNVTEARALWLGEAEALTLAVGRVLATWALGVTHGEPWHRGANDAVMLRSVVGTSTAISRTVTAMNTC
jgi:hypothetical protein